MTVEVYEDFYLFGVLLLFPLEVRDDSLQLRKQMVPACILFDVPMSIKVITLNSCSIVAQNYSIYVDHWKQNPAERIGIFY